MKNLTERGYSFFFFITVKREFVRVVKKKLCDKAPEFHTEQKSTPTFREGDDLRSS